MKETIAKISMLVHPNFRKTFYIHVDASKKGYGAILTQHPDDPLDKPAPKRSGIPKKHEIVAFASLALPKTHIKYTNSKRECYGAYWAINKFKEFIMGRDVMIFSDHQSLVKLCNSVVSTSRSELICGWLLEIAAVANRILHRPGKTLVIPDTLSRAHHVSYQEEDTQTPIKEVLERLGVKNAENKTKQEQTKMAILKLCSLSKTCHWTDESTGDGKGSLANMGQRADDCMGQLGGQSAQEGSRKPSQGRSSGIVDGSASHKTLDAVMGQLQTTPSRTECTDISDSGIEDKFGSCTQPGEPIRVHTVPQEHFPDKEPETAKSSDASAGHTGSESQNDSKNQWVIKDQERYWRGERAIDVRTEQMKDQFCQRMRNLILIGELPEYRKDAQKLLEKRRHYCLNKAGCLCRADIPTEMGEHPIVLPDSMVLEVVKHFHDYQGHRKFQKLYETMRDKFWFKGITQYISEYCQTCEICQKTKTTKYIKPPMGSTHVGYPNVTIHIDSTKGIEGNIRGYTYILSIVDAFTGYLTLFLLKAVNTREMAECLLKYVTIHSMPLEIVTNGGSEFRKALLKELTKIWGIHHAKVSPHNHKGNGKVKTIHSPVKNMMRAYIRKYVRDWDLLLPMVEFAYNTQVHSVTKQKPFMLQFGRIPTYPIDITLGTSNPKLVSPDEYVANIRDNMSEIFQLVNEKRRESEEQRVDDYNANQKTQILSVGDRVLLLNHGIKKKMNRKFNPRTQDDVHMIEEVCSPQTYKLRNLKTGYILPQPIHGSELRLYYERAEEEKEQNLIEGKELPPGDGRRSLRYRIVSERQYDGYQQYCLEIQPPTGRKRHEWWYEENLEGTKELKDYLEAKKPQRGYRWAD